MGHKGGLVILVLVSSFLWLFTGVGMGAMNPAAASSSGAGIAVLLPLLGAVVLTIITIGRVLSLRLASDPPREAMRPSMPVHGASSDFI